MAGGSLDGLVESAAPVNPPAGARRASRLGDRRFTPGGDSVETGPVVATTSDESYFVVRRSDWTVVAGWEPLPDARVSWGLEFSPDGRYLALPSDVSTSGLIVLDGQTGEIDPDWPACQDVGAEGDPGDRIYSYDVSWAPDGSRLFVGGFNATKILARLWVIDTATRTVESGWPDESTIGASVWKLAVFPGNDRVAIVGDGPPLNTIDFATKSLEGGWPFFNVVTGGDLAVSRDGAWIALIISSSWIRMIEVASKSVSTWAGTPTPDRNRGGVSFSPDGEKLAITYRDNGLVVYDATTQSAESGWPSPVANTIEGCAWSPDSAYLAVVAHDSTKQMLIIERATKAIVETLVLDGTASGWLDVDWGVGPV